MIAHLIKGSPPIEQSVLQHLEGTARIAKMLGEPLDMGNLAYLTALLHDLGKWRAAFEQYIRDAVLGFHCGQHVFRGSVNHSSAGAIYIYQRYYKGTPVQKLTAQLISMAILSHHGLNDCMSPEGKDCFRQRVENLDHLDYEEVMKNLESSDLSAEEIDQYFDKAAEEVRCLQQQISLHKLSSFFTNGLIQRMLLSVLIDADRLDTAVFYGDREDVGLTKDQEPSWGSLCQNMEKKMESFQGTDPISLLRKKIAQECLDFAVRPEGIYRLAVPTGGAKTLSSMRYALNHARIFHKKRIFYIAPYLSILEQNSQVFRETLKQEDMMLEHHSNVMMSEENSEEGSCADKYRHLTENWDSPLVFTTFVQFLNTLFDGSTSSVRRFHSLADSVILIDEIQSLPVPMIHMFNMAMNYLSRMCQATVILCSATQPVLDQVRLPIQMSQPADIIADVDGLYRKLKRVRIEEKKGCLTTEELQRFIVQIMNDQNDVLVILNTKTAAGLIYQALDSYYKETGEEVCLVHLSTLMCAQHRLDEINRIKKQLKKGRVICISTSLIEAGVDVSFSTVIRSYAGLDSIAQAAGRCNRNGEAEQGIVYLIHYEEERLGRLKLIQKGARCSETVVASYLKHAERYDNDLLSRPALNEFYDRYYYDRDQQILMDMPLKQYHAAMVDLLGGNRVGKLAYLAKNGSSKDPDLSLCQAFKTAGKEFAVIDQNTISVLVPYGKGRDMILALNGELKGREVMSWIRKSQRYLVNLYRDQAEKLNQSGALMNLNNGDILALKDGFYDPHLGVVNEGRQEFLDV